VLLAALSMMMVMSVPPAMAHHDVGYVNASELSNKSDDGADTNQGGGQEHIRHDHPPHGGGDQHGGGSV
jgi:hypothetical protein